MPRIDPQQLLTCLQVLLSPSGGILSKDEVHRLASLMTKFSKKLVSKCVYVLILTNTERGLLDAFMAAGGWTLIHLWLHDAMYSMNWALVTELLELLLTTPVDVERLKANNIPKLVKTLSKREDLQRVHELSNQLVQQWLRIVKDETQSEMANKLQTVASVAMVVPQQPQPQVLQQQLVEVPVAHPEEQALVETAMVTEESSPDSDTINTQTFYKLTLKDGKHLISKVDSGDSVSHETVENTDIEIKSSEEPKEKKEEKKKSNDKSSSSKHKSSSSKSSSRDKERSSSHKDRDRHSSSSNSSNKDKDRSRDKDKRDKHDKDKHRSNGSVKSSSSKNSSKDKDKNKKESKEKQAEKDKDTLAKLLPQSIQKLPKIPKKSTDDKDKADKSKDSKENKKEEPKKGTMSIEVRKANEERPKTVKVYKSKMRSTGLEEEAKPAPPRPTKKPNATVPPVLPPPLPMKRPSPIRDLTAVPPEKKPKIEPIERPGAIKLIPPKPKPPVLQESDMFMDALAASATTKKEPKKRKRRASVSKDSAGSPPTSPNGANSNPASSPILKNMAPPKFYQDTLETEDAIPENEDDDAAEKKDSEEKPESREEPERPSTPMDTKTEDQDEEVRTRDINGLKGVLVHGTRRGPKKSIKWKPDEELVDVQYFELDENERVNVTKTFGDMAKMDLRNERDALQNMSRKLPNEDVMDVQTMWRIPYEIDLPPHLADPGSKSLEKDIQFAREKSVLQALYFNKKMLPDSPTEPDPENYQVTDPVIIPIDDTDHPERPDHDYRTTEWPVPKSSPPPQNIPSNAPQVFPNVQGHFQNFGVVPPPAFQNVQNVPNMQQPFSGPPFMPQNMMPGTEWSNVNMPNMPGNMHNPQMMPRNMGPPEMMNQGPGPMNPNMFMPPPENFNPMMNETPNHRFPPPFNQQGPPGPGMFPPQNNFNHNRGGFRRGGGGSGPWLRMNGPGPGGWNNMRGGGGGPHRGSGRLCNHYRNKGFCKNRDKCPFFHPNN